MKYRMMDIQKDKVNLYLLLVFIQDYLKGAQ